MDSQPLQPPKGFTSLANLATIPLESDVSVIGVVVDYLHPAPTRGTDYSCSMHVQDSSLLGSHHNQTGVRLRLFRPPHQMPERVELGDIVMVRSTRWRDINGNKCLVDPLKNADYLFFSSASIPESAFKTPHIADEYRAIVHLTLPNKIVKVPSAEEQDYIIKLREWAKRHSDWLPQPGETPAPPKQLPPPRSAANTNTIVQPPHPRPGFESVPTGPAKGLRGLTAKFAFLKDVQDGRFHDLAGEVIKIWDANHVIDMYISDYTFNSQLFDYKEHAAAGDGRDGDPYGYTDSLKTKQKWQGPWGKHTICIALFEPHASYVRREIKAGDFVRIHNARCFIKDNQALQARLHEDKRHPDQVDVSKLSVHHDLYKAVNMLKDQYWESRGAKGKNSGSKKAKRKKKEQEEKKKRGENEAQEKEVTAVGQHEDDEEEEGSDETLFVKEKRDMLNKKVVAAHPDRALLTLTKIIETPFRSYRDRQGEEQSLPFVNQKCRSRLRVVDFFPHNLTDFAQCLDEPAYNDVPSSYDSSNISLDAGLTLTSRWEWAFYLLVEDARPTPGQDPVRMILLVHGKDADFLLRLEATDLRYNLEILSQLRRKLWTLWGDLEELKSEGRLSETSKPANYPFECCIDEYGIWEGDEQEGNWVRVHRIKQTTIHD